MGILYLVEELLREFKYLLQGDLYLYCENCGKKGINELVVVSSERRKSLGIDDPRNDLKYFRCPRCGTPFGDNLYLVKLFE